MITPEQLDAIEAAIETAEACAAQPRVTQPLIRQIVGRETFSRTLIDIASHTLLGKLKAANPLHLPDGSLIPVGARYILPGQRQFTFAEVDGDGFPRGAAKLAFIMPWPFLSGCEDLIAFDLNHRWWTLRGIADWLGEMRARKGLTGAPEIRLCRSPLSWLRERGQGIVALEKTAASFRRLYPLPNLVCDDKSHAALVHTALRRSRIQYPKLWSVADYGDESWSAVA
jgi:hypothetical protein